MNEWKVRVYPVELLDPEGVLVIQAPCNDANIERFRDLAAGMNEQAALKERGRELERRIEDLERLLAEGRAE